MTTAAHRRNSISAGLLRTPTGSLSVVVVGVGTATAGSLLAVLCAGGMQVRGVLVGAGLMIGFYLIGTLSVSLAAAHAPRASLLVALITYALQVTLLAAVFASLRRSGALESVLDPRWVGGGVIAATTTWIALLVLGTLSEHRRPEVRR